MKLLQNVQHHVFKYSVICTYLQLLLYAFYDVCKLNEVEKLTTSCLELFVEMCIYMELEQICSVKL